jgi:uncharacterized protein involved in response to NO
MRGAIVWRVGFRPWFLMLLAVGSFLFFIWGANWLYALVPATHNPIVLPSLLDWRWHAHEMIFGLGTALLAGFLLTAVQNWTGLRPLPPILLFSTVAIWLLARGVLLFVGVQTIVGFVLSAIPLLMVGGAIFRVILRQRQWHNLLFPVSLLIMAGLDVIFGLKIQDTALHGQYATLGLWPLLAIMLFIAQRILPAFTAARASVHSKSLGSKGAVLLSGGSLLLFLLNIAPTFPGQGAFLSGIGCLLVLVGFLGVWRWWHPIVWQEPMLLVIYAGFILTLIGLALWSLSWLPFGHAQTEALWRDAGIHGLGIGLLGIMGPGMVLRVSAGHTGRMISMPNWLRGFFILASGAWFIRLIAPPLGYDPILLLASAWGLAAVYLALLLTIGDWLVKPRVDGRL